MKECVVFSDGGGVGMADVCGRDRCLCSCRHLDNISFLFSRVFCDG